MTIVYHDPRALTKHLPPLRATESNTVIIVCQVARCVNDIQTKAWSFMFLRRAGQCPSTHRASNSLSPSRRPRHRPRVHRVPMKNSRDLSVTSRGFCALLHRHGNRDVADFGDVLPHQFGGHCARQVAQVTGLISPPSSTDPRQLLGQTNVRAQVIAAHEPLFVGGQAGDVEHLEQELA